MFIINNTLVFVIHFTNWKSYASSFLSNSMSVCNGYVHIHEPGCHQVHMYIHEPGCHQVHMYIHEPGCHQVHMYIHEPGCHQVHMYIHEPGCHQVHVHIHEPGYHQVHVHIHAYTIRHSPSPNSEVILSQIITQLTFPLPQLRS